MKAILFFSAVYAVMHGMLLAVAFGVGLFLHWLLPRVDFGTAILIGLVSTIASFHYFLRLLRAAGAPFESDSDSETRFVPMPQFRHARGKRRKEV